MNNSVENKKNTSGRTHDLYVGHVPKSIQEEALLEVFSKYGTVVDVLIRHSTGCYGYAIVKFKHKKDADKVLRQVTSIIVDNHEMKVRNGKRSSQSNENCNETTAVAKSVTFAEPPHAIVHHLNSIPLPETPVPVIDFQYPVYSAIENASVVPVTVEIMCTNVVDAVTFHGCSISNFEELQHLSIKLNSICPNLQPLSRKPVMNRIYGALYNADCQWYRCRVLQYSSPASPTCLVEYIDYGNVAEVCYTNMVELPEPLKNSSPFAFRCVFTNLVPTPKSYNCVTYLHHLINHRMSLCALHTWGTYEYLVTKCSCNGIDVISELVRNNYAMYQTLESPKLSPPKMDKFSTAQGNKKSKKNKNKKAVESSNGISKDSHEMKNGVHEKNNRGSSPIEIQQSQDFMPKKIIKRGSDNFADNNQILEAKAVNHFLKIDSVVSNVKVINNIRSLIPLDTYDDLIKEAVELLRSEINVSVSDDSKQLVENAKKEYCKALKEIKDCSDLELLVELKEKRNKLQIELCNKLQDFLNSFDCTLLEKRRNIQETITALESNSTAWLNVYLPKIPKTIEDLLVAFNEEKEKKRKKIAMARRNTDEKRAKFLKVYADLGKEFSLDMVTGAVDESHFISNIGKKGSWALKFDEALSEFGIALEEERKISTVIEDRSYVSVIQYILEKLDIPKDKIDAQCEVYEEYKSLYDDLINNSDLKPIFDELYTLNKVIKSFCSCSNHANTERSCDELLKLHSDLLREDVLLGAVIKASAQHFPELIREHPELNLEEYQKYFCLMKLNWDICFFPYERKCNRIESSYISKLGEEPIVIKKFNIDSEDAFVKKVKMWNEIKSSILVKIKGLFKGKLVTSISHEVSSNVAGKSVNGDITHEIEEEKPEEFICDDYQDTVNHVNGESKTVIKKNCQWLECDIGFMTQEDLLRHLTEDHIEKNKPLVCQWKNCPRKEKPFKSQNLLVAHIPKHSREIFHLCTTRSILYAVVSPVWDTLYDKPLPVPVDYKMALNILQQVLEGLCDIHSRGIVHGAIHPMSVLHKDGKVMLDFSLDKTHLKDNLCLKGINFQVPNEDLFKSADMYGFGCLVLWVLFPNLSFQSTDKGVPNISAFQSIIEDVLLPKDFISVSALLNVNCNIRPTSRMLRSSGFLKDLHIVSGSSSSSS